jgi:hypothetical protein
VSLGPVTGGGHSLGSTRVGAFPDVCRLKMEAEMASETLCVNCTLDNGQSSKELYHTALSHSYRIEQLLNMNDTRQQKKCRSTMYKPE